MRVSVSWLREYVDLPADLPAGDLEQALVDLGIEVESIVDLRETVTGPLVVGEVLEIEELTGFKKPIRFCRVDVGAANGTGEPQEIVCGARNFAPGDRVVVILPGGVLPGNFAIGARKTYGRNSHGMICSAKELGLGDDHSGIIVLPEDTPAKPGDDARPVVGLDDVVVEMEITPDRGYALSVRGIARELSHALGVPFRDPADVPAPGATAEPAYPVQVRDTVGCDRFAARMVRGVDPTAQTPGWLAQRLTVAGIRSISLPVDITNYLMLELGQPMHAFDADRISGPLVVRRAAPGEKLTTLDGVTRTLVAEDMVICDDTGPVSLAAVMGGETSEVVASTTNVLFEAAHWDPAMVGRTARRHKLFSEAAKRWERGVDPALALVALEKAVRLLTEHGGGAVGEEILDIDHVRPRTPVTLPADLPSRRIGVSYPPERVVELLEQVGCTVVRGADRLGEDPGEVGVPAAGAGEVLTVTPPSWRPDLTDPADLVEEVVRLDGYDRVPSELPTAPAGRGLTWQQVRRRAVARSLAERGYVEVLAHPFVSADLADQLGLPADDPRRPAVRVANPLSEEEPLLRTTLLGPLLGILKRNVGRGQRDVAIYEIGAVFHPRPGAGSPPAMGVDRRPTDEEFAAADAVVPDQPRHVAVALAGEIEPAGWWGAGRAAGWADAVEAGRMVLAAAGIPADRVTVRAAEHAPWHPGRCAELRVDDTPVGYAGELHPVVVAALELPRRTSAMELNLDALPAAPLVSGPAISTFPPALIDVALVLDESVPAAEVERALVEGAGALLEGVRLFDVYASEQLGAGRKSLAYKLTFRAPDRTLTVEEAVAARDAAVALAAQRFGATLRGA
ncbi:MULTISPECIES: phenylalanine--tRNA ligase subunit beta [Micromonospora]|uniref:Phenylalanine--tRNA ligase beta subunit n=1 Tax=Micromonospora solifontis TaxID=2487138 RepID=A0ABX9WM66_9ACTN|nr:MULTISPECIES: phenylalanine--tRNA ligase subunit beta [Micromonospora]NES13527.1 phenylalanine--tRNA ligase subunit beta [Micromonospora sp. PPF5-17B]NES35651.1 phenylalanine--tRNA ligase subunit beta [Micromonospora solifontis]NES58298.1 phenylalanine--tRNA ligase subunit beta [Micromonospora sp. PPF5-6]RNM00531.1 phenylalanine--tRNA ligase subunit beta [Micromonospora solifontis]